LSYLEAGIRRLAEGHAKGRYVLYGSFEVRRGRFGLNLCDAADAPPK
jgi:hypothetical protein